MKHLWKLVLIGTLLLSFENHAQSNKQQQLIDSLQTILQTTLPSTLHIQALNELAWIYRNNDYSKSYNFGIKAKNLAIQLKDNKGLATAYNRIGLVSQYQGNYTKALTFFEEALKIEKKSAHTYGIARSYNQIGSVQILNKNYSTAIKSFNLSIELLKKIGKLKNIAIRKANLALCYNNLGETSKAIECYLDALEIYKSQKKKSRLKMAKAYLGLGNLYRKNRDLKSSHKYLFEARDIFQSLNDKRDLAKTQHAIGLLYFKLKNYSKSLDYYKKSLSIKQLLKSNQNLGITCNNLGAVYLEQNKLSSARIWLVKSFELAKEYKNTSTLAVTYLNLGLLEKKEKRYQNSIDYFIKSKELSSAISDRHTKKDALENLSYAYSKLGDYAMSFKYFNRYKRINDSLETSFRQAIEIKDKYEEEKKKRELAEKDTEIQKGKVIQQTLLNYILGIGLLLSLIVVLAMVRTYQDRRKVRKKQQKIDDLLHEQEFLALSKMLEGQEQERNRVAQDLHDRLGGILSVLKIRFASLRQFLSAQNQPASTPYQQAQDLIEEAVTSVRAIAHDMSSKALERFGLIPALKDLKTHIESSRTLEVDLIATGFDNRRLLAKYEAQAYRIIQELMSNILKHAQASEVEVQLIWKEGNLFIGVEDDGKGFDVEKALRKSGLGLGSLQSRVKALEGEYKIDSSEGNGTRVMIDIPLNYLEESSKELAT